MVGVEVTGLACVEDLAAGAEGRLKTGGRTTVAGALSSVCSIEGAGLGGAK